MGLDSWVRAIKHEFDDEVDGDWPERGYTEIFYWRKHYDLHDWMERLYYNKGGSAESFNCVKVRLTNDDLDNLEKTILTNCLPNVDPCLQYGEDDLSNDLRFIVVARKAISDGCSVFYDSWW